jgi:2-dehydropantoate 2-reductase
MPRYIIFGAGAIGSILGAVLHRSGQDVVLVGRGSHVEAIRKEGLRLVSEGVPRRIKVSATEDFRGIIFSTEKLCGGERTSVFQLL